MTGKGTLIVSRAKDILPTWKRYLEDFGFRDVSVTSEEKNELARFIKELKPGIVFIESCFYQAGTPYMLGRLLRDIPKLNICVFSIGEFSDNLALLFFFHGVKSYINFREGIELAVSALEQIRTGNTFFSPAVKKLIDYLPEYPDFAFDVSGRQMEVLVLLSNGFKPHEIGAGLFISKRTVDKHIEELYEIFHVHGKEELATIARDLNLITRNDICFSYNKPEKIVLPPQLAVINRTCTRRSMQT